jgi:hypothetical protein
VRCLATFRLVGEGGGTAARVSELLGLTPSKIVEAGELLRSRQPAELSMWSLSSAQRAEDGVELAAALGRVLDQLEPESEALWALTRKGYWANWFCYVGSGACEHAVELDRATLGRLLALPGELWLDVNPDDLHGDDENGEGDGAQATTNEHPGR